MKELERPERALTIPQGVSLKDGGLYNPFFTKTLNAEDFYKVIKYIDHLETSMDELIKDNVKSEDHLYRKLISTQKERDELKEDYKTVCKSYDDCEHEYELQLKIGKELRQELQTLKDAVKELLKIFKSQIHAMDNIGKNPPDKVLQKIFSDIQTKYFKQLDKLKELIGK